MRTNHNSYYRILVGIMALLSMTGCAPVYKMRHYNGDAIKGWAIVSHNRIYTAFTADDNGVLPEDESLAKSRFERRKDFLAKYYKIDHPGTKALKELPLVPVGFVLFPVFLIDEYRVHVFGHGHDLSDEERAKIAAKQAAEEKVLKDFITADMQHELLHQ